jgi:hypothetical protein
MSMKDETFPVRFPPGSREGYTVVIPEAGNELILNMQKTKGNLVVRVAKVDSEPFKITADRVELRIEMTVKEALEVLCIAQMRTIRLTRALYIHPAPSLHLVLTRLSCVPLSIGAQGFSSEFEYLGGRVLRVDRQDRVTLPQSNITVPGMGFPKLPESLSPKAAETDDQDENRGAEQEILREDLVILFDLSAMPSEGSEDSEEQIVDLDDEGPTIISNQEEIDRFIKKQSASRDELLGRKLLMFLAEMKRRRESE